MKIALVHDYLNEFGGAERVLKVLSEMYSEAPIFTAFCKKDSTAWKYFRDKNIIESKYAPFLKIGKLYSPLRFLAPQVWKSFNFYPYDVIISSASWYITKGINKPTNSKHICYCHTPPRYLYGYPTAIEWQKYWPVKIYAGIVNNYLRKYDFESSKTVDQFVVNSRNVARRVKKFYGRESKIIYPPINVKELVEKTKNIKKENYYLIVSRVVGAKGIDIAIRASNKIGFKLKIVGEATGFSLEEKKLKKIKSKNVEFLGRVSDERLWEFYAKAKGFLALAYDEDFGMTVVEAMASGTPALAYYGGGYKETIKEGETGEFFYSYDLEGFIEGFKKFEKMEFKKHELLRQANKFSRENFEKEMRKTVGF